MTIIRLAQSEWNVDFNNQLGPTGGFGAVFSGSNKYYSDVAIKRLHITSENSANRELRVAEKLMTESFDHVIPVYDAGQDAETSYYYIVMAKASHSLRDEIEKRGVISEQEALQILLQITEGLFEVKDLIHRDIKPGNVLFHQEAWKLSDFGIAKFVEESTSLQTLKDCLSPQYAAPEQWKLETSSSATDLYALGCIAHHLITGAPPFNGSSISEYQNQHLYVQPNPLNAKDSLFRGLVSMLLRKNPEARPTLERVKTTLERIVASQNAISSNNGLNAIASAGAIEAERISAIETRILEEKESQKRRADLAAEAFNILGGYREVFFQKLQESAQVSKRISDSKISLGAASLEISYMNNSYAFSRSIFSRSGWDVICGALIKISQENPKYTWSASLWYTNQGDGNPFEWVEVSYWADKRNTDTPFALEDPNAMDMAHAKIVSGIHIAYKPKIVDELTFDEFIVRWSLLFAKAHSGELRFPAHLPLD